MQKKKGKYGAKGSELETAQVWLKFSFAQLFFIKIYITLWFVLERA